MTQDWPQWRRSGRDGKAAGFTAPAQCPRSLSPEMESVRGGGADSTPALVGDKLYVLAAKAPDEVILSLGCATGKGAMADKYAVPR